MVEWKKMWELTTWDKKFNGLENYMQPKIIKYHYYLAKELADLERLDGDIRILYTTDRVAFANFEDVSDNISEGEVVTIPWGGNVSIKYFKGKFITADNRIATSNDIKHLSNKFLYYWMSFQKDVISSFYRGAGIKHPSMMMVLNMLIPIPSLSEQNRIVGILDTFTASIDNLKEQIAQRRKQYKFYRDQLLDLEGKGYKMIVQNFCELKAGKAIKVEELRDYSKESPYPCYGGNGVRGFLSRYSHEGDYPIIGRQGALCGCVNWASGKLYATEHAVVAKGKENVIQRFLFYLFTHADLNQYKTQGAQPGLSVSKLNSITFYIPPLTEQSRIVSILDQFEASIANLEQQLSLRQKQYEYYRNKLLTFE